jgi:hypothetical protein
MITRILALLLLFNTPVLGKGKLFDYKRELKGIRSEWHRIILPDDIFGKINPDFSDLRILAVTKKDTFQIPYLLNVEEDQNITEERPFKMINKSETTEGFYYTFEMPAEITINQILPHFRVTDFDWRVNLEGSNDQGKWFLLLKDYRISAYHNDFVRFQFSRIIFPVSKYRYFRLLVKSKVNPELGEVKISSVKIIRGESRNYACRLLKSDEDKQRKKSVYYLELTNPEPVASVMISAGDTIDYYRPVKIEYLCDSVQAPHGWNYIYSELAEGIVNSEGKTSISFPGTITKKLRITISNLDNQPLKIDSFTLKGYVHELIGRFSKASVYYLTYGNKRLSKPTYDLEHFRNKIPSTISVIAVDKEEPSKVLTGWNFFNSSLLWIIIFLIIVFLSWLTIRMIRNKV